MGSCLSAVLPRRTSRGSSMEESTHLAKDEDSVRQPDDVNNIHLPNVEGNTRLPKPKDGGNAPLPKVEDNIRLTKDEEGIRPPKDESNVHLPNGVGNKTEVAATKRRALLVGITYTGPANKWSPLDGPHDDVDRYWDLLISA